MSLLATAALIGLALLGLPLFLVILGVTLLGQQGTGLEAPVVFVEIFDKIADNPIFMTIPLFAHAGFVLSESGAPRRLIEVSRAFLGWLPGGTALVTVVACALFTAFTGASGVTIIALGGLLYPVLREERYPEHFNLGLLTTGGSLGLLFPPSLPLIVFALIASHMAPVGVETLFLAGIVPGLLLILVLGLYGCWVSGRCVRAERLPFRLGRALRALRGAAFELPIPAIIVFGVFGGFLTIAQAAAVVAVYVSLVEVLVYRDLDLAAFLRTTARSMILTGGILVIIMAALAMTNHLTDQEVPKRILALMEEHIDSRWSFLLFLNLFLLVVGCLMDIFSAILVVVPLILPVALRFGVDPVHLGVIFLTNLEIGYSTPPVGINLFISSLRFRKPVVTLYRASLPFLGLLLLCLGVITWVPDLSLFLVRQVEGTASAEIRWQVLEEEGGAGRGELRWSQRPAASDAAWEEPVPLPAEAAAEETPGLSLGWSWVLEPGPERPGRARFELARPAGRGGPRVRAVWEAKMRSPGELTGGVFEALDLDLRPAAGPLAVLSLEPENWTYGAVEIEAVDTGGVVQGVLRAVALWFPEDENLPEELYDLELRFTARARTAGAGFPELGPEARRHVLPDLRVSWRPVEGGGPPRATFLLERTRSRPWGLYASWTAEAAAPQDLAGRRFEAGGLRLHLEDVSGELFPRDPFEVDRAEVAVEAVEDGRIRGLLRALLRKEGRRFAVEVPFDLPLRRF